MDNIQKYPRTPHLEGSRLQAGDEDHSQIPFSALAGKYIVVEEKMDGANSGISYNSELAQMLQSRGHYLTGGGREKHFNMLKSWAAAHDDALFDILEDRYLMYGEWMHSKHTVFYDRLPHYFLEFDIYDRHQGIFLSTAARRELLEGSPVVSVPVLYEGVAPRRIETLLEMIRPSLAKSEQWMDNLKESASRQELDVDRILRETEQSGLAEGLYIKVEEGLKTVDRLKWVRSDFLQTIVDNDTHWLARPIVQNQLAPGVDIFSASVMPWPTEPAIRMSSRCKP